MREALFLLEKAGLVEVPARRRPRVAILSDQAVENVYALRARLHGMLGELLAQRASRQELARLDVLVGRMTFATERGDVDADFWINVTFHDLCARICGNIALKRASDSLGIQVLRLRHATMSVPGRLDLSLEDHRRLMRALHEQDVNLAGAINSSIVEGAYRALARPMASDLGGDGLVNRSDPPACRQLVHDAFSLRGRTALGPSARRRP